MLDTDAAWAAGFIDGDGSITMYMNDTNVSIALNAAQIGLGRRRALDRLAALFGGKVWTRHAATYSGKTRYDWSLYGPKAIAAIIAMQPYFVEKVEQAKVVVAYAETLSLTKAGKKLPTAVRDERFRLLGQMRELNTRSG